VTGVPFNSGNLAIGNWTTVVTDAGGNFDATTGIYTVPSTGLYEIVSIFDYRTAAAITVQLSGGTPQFRFTDNTGATIWARSDLSVLNVNILLLISLNSVLSIGAVPVTAVVSLTAGQTVQPRYASGGLVALGTTFSLNNNGTNFFIRRIA
jgi:hypothetical protein